MILGTKVRYAVMSLAYIAKKNCDTPTKLAEISDTQEIPLSYLEQIFLKLKKQDIVKSVRGPGGGYILAREIHAIPISHIAVAVDESIKMTRCKKGQGGCMSDNVKCMTHDLWAGLSDHIYGYLDDISLANLVDHKLEESAAKQANVSGL